jgi:hypothetical protein
MQQLEVQEKLWEKKSLEFAIGIAVCNLGCCMDHVCFKLNSIGLQRFVEIFFSGHGECPHFYIKVRTTKFYALTIKRKQTYKEI